ncbi:MAG: hypothetical protein C0606_15220 [Hyphomicrobiales bacterium]|nr:MAG: hypothetical protein C0606_15220 [Hyphomicrobiales bacterium]
MTTPEKPSREPVSIDATENLFSGFLRLDRLTVSHDTRDGRRLTVERLIHDHGNAVAVLPVDPRRRTVLLVRQLRMPVYLNPADAPGAEGGMLVEACAGLIDGDGEGAAATAEREAIEELGYRIHDLTKVAEVYMSPGAVTERVTYFLATYDGDDDRVADGGGLHHEGEDIEVLEWSCDELRRALGEGRVHDGKLVVLAQALQLAHPHLFA